MEQAFILVYAKDGKIKVFPAETAKVVNDALIKDDWKHTATLDACVFIRYLHNEEVNIVEEIKSLSMVP